VFRVSWREKFGEGKDVRSAGLPRDVDLVREGHGGVVVGELACGGGGVGAQADAVVDIQDAAVAAGGPDDGGGGDVVFFCVFVAGFPLGAGDGGACCCLGS
jgi:hypothetical protein